MSARFHITQFHRNAEWLRGLKPSEINLILAAADRADFSQVGYDIPRRARRSFATDAPRAELVIFFETPNGKRVILMWIRPGDVFGATTLVSQPSSYLASTEAVRDSTVLVWDRAKISSLARRFPQLLENVLIIATNYFHWYVTAHAALVSQSARERLANVVGLAESIGQKACGFVEIDVTNEELASSANITPYTANRMISNWERDGVIRKKRGKILLQFPEKLFLRTAGH